MGRIRCFLLEPTSEESVKLRRYSHQQGGCPQKGYHDASLFLERLPVQSEHQDLFSREAHSDISHDDSRWPTACACGYTFSEQDEWQYFIERLYRRADTGELLTLKDAPAGAMWYSPWFDQFYIPQDEHVLVVKTPGGDWIIDSQASNCTMPEDHRQEKHHCWVRAGTPPDVTAGKDGPTCAAGAGSIQCGTYHGFLRNGYLEE